MTFLEITRNLKTSGPEYENSAIFFIREAKKIIDYYKFNKKITLNEGDIEDICQDSFVKIFNAIKNDKIPTDNEACASAYIKRAIWNVICDQGRQIVKKIKLAQSYSDENSVITSSCDATSSDESPENIYSEDLSSKDENERIKKQELQKAKILLSALYEKAFSMRAPRWRDSLRDSYEIALVLLSSDISMVDLLRQRGEVGDNDLVEVIKIKRDTAYKNQERLREALLKACHQLEAEKSISQEDATVAKELIKTFKRR